VNILWPDIHLNLTKNMAKAFNLLGHTIIIPSSDYKITHRPPQQFSQFVWNETWTQEKADKEFSTKNVKILNKQEILDLKPEVVFITNFESQFEILNEIWPILKSNSKLACYSGNDYWDGAYPFYIIKNYLMADYTGFVLAQKYGVNHLYYKPWIDYDQCNFTGTSDNPSIGIYIHSYEKNFPNDYKNYLTLKEHTPFVNYDLHDNSTHQQVIEAQNTNFATLHLKQLEGYGIAVIESMARGRPVFLHREQSRNKSLSQWSIENLTALYFSSFEEYNAKLKAFTESKDYRHYLQVNTASAIRQIINNQKETEKLGHFLNNLV